jgi:hypothetical protein
MPKYLAFFWILALVFSSQSNAEQLLQMTATPIWNSQFKLHKATEVHVQLLSQHSGLFNLTINKLTKAVELTANKPFSTEIPFVPDFKTNANTIQISHKTDAAALTSQQNLSLLNSRKPIVAIVASNLQVQEPIQELQIAEQASLVTVTAESLPYFGSSYENIELLAIGYTELKSLKEAQLLALTNHLTQCGKLIAVGFPEPVLNSLKQTTGCQGQFLLSINAFADLANQIVKLLPLQQILLPEVGAIPIAEKPATGIQPKTLLLAFCFGYLFLVLIFALLNKNKTAFYGLPVLVTGVTVLVWYHQQPETKLISVVEAFTNQTSARYTAQLSMQGAGNWQEEIELPMEAFFSAPTSTAQNQWSYKLKNTSVTTAPSFSLFSKNEWQWHGAINIELPLNVVLKNQQPVITNISQQPSQQGLLKWQDKIYQLPSLSANESWTLDVNNLAQQSELTERLSAQNYSCAADILLPFAPKLLNFGEQNGWLLLHAECAQ